MTVQAALPALRTEAPAPVGRRVAGRLLLLLGAALAVAAVVQHVRLPPLCLLRAATGVPCPFCGGTTAMAELGDGRPLAALATSPLAVLGGPVWAAWPAMAGRLRRPRLLLPLGAAVVAASWVWQLVRVLG